MNQRIMVSRELLARLQGALGLLLMDFEDKASHDLQFNEVMGPVIKKTQESFNDLMEVMEAVPEGGKPVAMAEYDGLMVMEGYDEALLGMCLKAGEEPVAAYDTNAVIALNMRDHEMSAEDAVHFFQYNQLGAAMGKLTPAFIVVAELQEIAGEEEG